MFECRFLTPNSRHSPDPKNAGSFDVLCRHMVKDYGGFT